MGMGQRRRGQGGQGGQGQGNKTLYPMPYALCPMPYSPLPTPHSLTPNNAASTFFPNFLPNSQTSFS
jgi:hypothetical protein